MTVTNQYEPARTNGNAITTEFSFTFKVQDESDLKVYLVDDATNTPVLQTITSDYTVSLNTVTDGGSVTFLSAPAADEDVLIERVVSLVQPTDIPNVGAIVESQLEDEYDNSRIIDQQITEEQSRMYRLTVADSTLFSQMSFDLPTPEAGKGLIWSTSGNSIQNTTSDLSDIDDAVQDATNAAASAQAFAITAGNHATSAQGFAITASNAANTAVTAAGAVRVNKVEWQCNSQTQAVVYSGSYFTGVDSGTLFTFTTNRTFDITGTAGTLGSLNTGSEASSTFYYLIALGDTTNTVSPHIIGVSAANYASFGTGDLTGNYSDYDDYKRIGVLRNHSTGHLVQGYYVDKRFFTANPIIAPAAASTSSASLVDLDFSTYLESFIRRAEFQMEVANGANASLSWKDFSNEFPVVEATAGDTNRNSFEILLDSSQIVEGKTTANTLSLACISYYDDLTEEGQ